MQSLIVLANPNPQSFSHSVVEHLAIGITSSGSDAPIVADLFKEGFDPRFNLEDVVVHQGAGASSPAVKAEQERVDRADVLILVFPVYWWSMPALLKGWIDRVFNKGWAFNEGPQGLEKRLGRLTVHLVAVSGADRATFERHGYLAAMQKQIDYGIFEYCGAKIGGSHLLALEGVEDLQLLLDTALRIGEDIGRSNRD